MPAGPDLIEIVLQELRPDNYFAQRERTRVNWLASMAQGLYPRA